MPWPAGIGSGGPRSSWAGCTSLSCPERGPAACRRRGDRRGRAGLGTILEDVEAGTLAAGLSRRLSPALSRRPAAAARNPARDSYLTTGSMIATRGCHNRCGFCYLSTDGLQMPYMVRDVEQVVAEIRDAGQPYVVFMDNNLGSNARLLAAALPGLAAAGDHLERGGVDRRDRRSRRWCARWRWPAARACSWASSRWQTQRRRRAGRRSPPAEDYARRVAIFHRLRHASQRQLRLRLRPRPAATFSRRRWPGSRRTGWSAPRSTS